MNIYPINSKNMKNLILVGDFNIVPNESDAHNFSAENILC